MWLTGIGNEGNLLHESNKLSYSCYVGNQEIVTGT